MTKDELLLQIKNAPHTAKNYMLLAFMLNSPEETVTLLKQNPLDPEELTVVLTQQQLFLKTIQLDPGQSTAYLALKNQLVEGETITLNDGRALTKGQLILEAIHNAPTEPLPYSAMAFVTEGDSTATLRDGRVMNKNQLYLEAVHLERQIGLLWFREKYFVTPPGTVTLPDGRQYSQEQLVTAIATPQPQPEELVEYSRDYPLDPPPPPPFPSARQDYLAIAGLVLTMKAATQIFIPNQLPSTSTPPPGRDNKREDLAIEAIKSAINKIKEVEYILNNPRIHVQDPEALRQTITHCDFPYFVLLLTMNPGDTVDTGIPAIGSTGHLGILKEAIRLSPLPVDPFLFGGLWLKPGETITLSTGQSMNQKQMLLKVLELQPTNALAHIGLGYSIGASETITIAGTAMNRQQLFLKAATLDPDLPLAYLCLSLSITPGDTTPLTVNGQPMTEIELYEKYNSFNEVD